MNCLKCGKELREGARVCFFCGARVDTHQPVIPIITIDPAQALKAPDNTSDTKETAPKLFIGDIEEQVAREEATYYTPDSSSSAPESFGTYTSAQADIKPPRKKAPKKRKKIIILVAAILAAVLLLGAGVTTALLLINGNDKHGAPTMIPAYISPMGDAYMCYDDGNFFKVGGNVSASFLTPDRSRAFVIGEDGSVYLKSVDDETTTSIRAFGATTTLSVCYVTNEMTVFNTVSEDGTEAYVWRYVYGSDSLMSVADLNSCAAITVSNASVTGSDGISVAYADKGFIYILRHDASTPDAIASYSTGSTVLLNGISDDGRTLVWSTDTDVYLYSNGSSEILPAAQPLGQFTVNSQLAESGITIITSSTDGRLYIKQNSQPTVCVTLPGMLNDSYVMTDADKLIEVETVDGIQTGFLVRCMDVLTNEGTRETPNSSLYLISTDGSYQRLLYDIYDVVYANKTTFYFIENDTLYAYDTLAASSTLIETDVSSMKVSLDGEKVYYILNATTVRDIIGTLTGELYCYSPDDGREHIADDVICGSLTSHLTSDRIDDSSAWFEVYGSATTSGYLFNATFYNGKETRAVIKNIER